MKTCPRFRKCDPVVGSCVLTALVVFANPKYPDYPSETPDNFKPTNYGFEYERRDVMIPMRDGVKLHTVILVPNGRKTRTDPDDADAVQRDRL